MIALNKEQFQFKYQLGRDLLELGRYRQSV